MPLGVFCRASLADHLDADDLFELTRAGFAFFERLFGVPYPFEKYDQPFVPEFNAGAMENAGAVTFLENCASARVPPGRWSSDARSPSSTSSPTCGSGTS